MQVPSEHVRIAKVVGENEEGLTLFVPKDMTGKFTINEGDEFLTMMFVRQEDDTMITWLPWEG